VAPMLLGGRPQSDFAAPRAGLGAAARQLSRQPPPRLRHPSSPRLPPAPQSRRKWRENGVPGQVIEPKWQVADKLVKEVRDAVEKKHLTPLDGARVISSIAATLFGYDEFILREISPETLLATPSRR
jgi:hypothetical protein